MVSIVETRLLLARAKFSYLVCAVLALGGQLLPCPREAAADPLLKISAVAFSCAMLPSP